MNNVCLFVCVFLCFVTFQCKCLFSLVSIFCSFCARVCLCVLYNLAFSHLFYNWDVHREPKIRRKTIFIVKTIHCMWVFVFVYVCVSVALQNKRDLCFVCLLRYCNFWLYIFLLLLLSYLHVVRETVNYLSRFSSHR